MSPANNFTARSDQWDIRLNVPDQEWVDFFILNIEEYCNEGTVKYCHISGIEIGDVPGRTSYGIEHIHIALVLNNYTSKRSVVKKFTSITSISRELSKRILCLRSIKGYTCLKNQ